MRQIETHVDIAASPQTVWAILTDFAAYPNWNPFITSILQNPSYLRVCIKPAGQRGMVFKPKIQVMIPNQNLTWLGHLWMPGLFDGLHEFRIEALDQGCRFHQSEKFSGPLVGLFGQKLLDSTRSGFESMNSALKELAETRHNQ